MELTDNGIPIHPHFTMHTTTPTLFSYMQKENVINRIPLHHFGYCVREYRLIKVKCANKKIFLVRSIILSLSHIAGMMWILVLLYSLWVILRTMLWSKYLSNIHKTGMWYLRFIRQNGKSKIWDRYATLISYAFWPTENENAFFSADFSSYVFKKELFTYLVFGM